SLSRTVSTSGERPSPEFRASASTLKSLAPISRSMSFDGELSTLDALRGVQVPGATLRPRRARGRRSSTTEHPLQPGKDLGCVPPSDPFGLGQAVLEFLHPTTQLLHLGDQSVSVVQYPRR